MANNVIERIPEDLRRQGVDLSQALGVNSLAWHPSLVFQIIQWCKENNIAILGGDVIEIATNGKLLYTYDNWYINLDSKLIWQDFVAQTVDYSAQKIEFYNQIFQTRYVVFDLVFHSQ